ncbi:hypothetical protein BDZ89DRAFT_1042366 [Hymenopellis radicata]|nr:hypothetical protein BDZ89DRAFT_1042366 [Hymenopellis radicata]
MITWIAQKYRFTDEDWLEPIRLALSPDYSRLTDIDDVLCDALGVRLFKIISVARESYHQVKAEMALTMPKISHDSSCPDHPSCEVAFAIFWTSKVVLKIFARSPHYTFKTARALTEGTHIPFMTEECKNSVVAQLSVSEDAIQIIREKAENACVRFIDPSAAVPHPIFYASHCVRLRYEFISQRK